MTNDLIRRDVLLDIFDSFRDKKNGNPVIMRLEIVISIIETVTAVEAEPVMHGKLEHRQERCEMNDLSIAMDLMKCFHGSFINHNGEFIAHRYGEAYFSYATCEDELDVKCKVLEWLSRPASKGQPFKSDRANEKYQQFMLDGINKYLGTNFSHDDIDEVYTYLGNRCNHAKTIAFIESGYDTSILPVRLEKT